MRAMGDVLCSVHTGGITHMQFFQDSHLIIASEVILHLIFGI